VKLSDIWKHRHLTLFLVRREIEQRYRGSVLGIFWILLSSLLMLGIYTFVFNVIFVSRWPGAQSDRVEVFAIILFAGLSMYSFASECWSRATSLIADNVTYVTKVVFPIELLPLVIVLASFVQFMVNLAIVLVASLIILGVPSLPIVSFPVILIPFVFLVLGVTYLLAFAGAFIRDMRMIVPFVLTALLYLSPVLYPVKNTPPSIQPLFFLNPLTFFFEAARGSLFFNQWPSLMPLAMAWGFSIAALGFGFYVFHRGSRAFADVL
jgi:lipopolysaccharide transport system permease protein